MAFDSKISRFPYHQREHTHPLRSSKKSELHCVTTSRLCQPSRLGFIPNYQKVTYLFIYVIFALTVTNVPYPHPTPPRFIWKANNKIQFIFSEAKLFTINKKWRIIHFASCIKSFQVHRNRRIRFIFVIRCFFSGRQIVTTPRCGSFPRNWCLDDKLRAE